MITEIQYRYGRLIWAFCLFMTSFILWTVSNIVPFWYWVGYVTIFTFGFLFLWGELENWHMKDTHQRNIKKKLRGE